MLHPIILTINLHSSESHVVFESYPSLHCPHGRGLRLSSKKENRATSSNSKDFIVPRPKYHRALTYCAPLHARDYRTAYLLIQNVRLAQNLSVPASIDNRMPPVKYIDRILTHTPDAQHVTTRSSPILI